MSGGDACPDSLPPALLQAAAASMAQSVLALPEEQEEKSLVRRWGQERSPAGAFGVAGRPSITAGGGGGGGGAEGGRRGR